MNFILQPWQLLLVVAEENAFLAEFLEQSCDLGVLKLNDLCLTLIHPTYPPSPNDSFCRRRSFGIATWS